MSLTAEDINEFEMGLALLTQVYNSTLFIYAGVDNAVKFRILNDIISIFLIIGRFHGPLDILRLGYHNRYKKNVDY